MIRELNIHDLESFKKLSNEYKCNFQKLYNLESLISNKYEKVYVYEKQHEILGFILIEKTFEVLSVLHLYVAKNYRKLGIASLLIDFILSDVNIKRVILEVRVDNQPAINLYKKHGFNIIHTRKKYYKDVDAYVMEKRVQNEEC